jgi:hypothetical protein
MSRWRDYVRDTQRLDAACELLRLAARTLGMSRIELDVRADGRVELRGIGANGFTLQVERADILPDTGDSLQHPSASLCDLLDAVEKS